MLIMVKQREYTLEVDEFNNPGVLEGDDAIRVLITRLLVLEPGSDPLHPDMGVGIKNYRFNSGSNSLNELEKVISNQLSKYLPNFSNSQISLSLSPEHILNINITIGDTTYSWNSSVNDTDSSLSDLTK